MSDDGKGGYLVTEKDGTEHLPTRKNGKLDHGLLGAAHAALFKTFRGKGYEGPDKEEAKKKLRKLYEEAGIEWPGEGNSETSLSFTIALGEIPTAGLVRMPVAITGSWTHPGTRQKVNITLADLRQIIENFEKKANGEINVDYDHASAIPNFTGGARPSAGRVLSMEPPREFTDRGGTRRHILYAGYEPTEMARDLIRKREYRYVSPVLDGERVDKASGEPQGMTMTTIALTNTPVLEEMPEVHLSEGSQQLVDAGAENVDPNFSIQENQSQMPAAAGMEEMMKKFKVKKLADGEHKGKHGVFDDGDTMVGLAEVEPDADDKNPKSGEAQFAEFLADVGLPNTNAEGLKKLIDDGVKAQAAAKATESRRILLSEVIVGGKVDTVKGARLAAAGKITGDDFALASEAQQRVDRAIGQARLLPRHRGQGIQLCLWEPDLFKDLIEGGRPIVNLKPATLGAASSGDAGQDLIAMAKARASEKSITYGQALSEVSREHPDLAKAHRGEVVKDPAS